MPSIAEQTRVIGDLETRWLSEIAPLMPAIDPDFTYGLEIECVIPRGRSTNEAAVDAFCNECAHMGVVIQPESYNHMVRGHWKVVTDGSVHSNQGTGGAPREIVSPILSGQDGFRQLWVICSRLAEANAYVNDSCGMHVHHAGSRAGGSAMGLIPFQVLYRRYAQCEGIIDQISPSNRKGRSSQYAKSIVKGNRRNDAFTVEEMGAAFRDADGRQNLKTLHEAFTGMRCDCPQTRRCDCGARYFKLNPGMFWRQGTMEFRQHAGTTNFWRIVHWTALTQAFMTSARATGGEGTRALLRNILPRPMTSTQMFQMLRYSGRLDPLTIRHFERRLEQQAALQSKAAKDLIARV